MTQSFHAGATPTHHPTKVLSNRRRTDLTPTITPGTMGMGQSVLSRETSRASTPGRQMLMSGNMNGRSPGKAVSMSRIDQLARPRMLNINPHQTPSPSSEVSPTHATQLSRYARLSHRRDRMAQVSLSKKSSVSMDHLNRSTTNSSAAVRTRQRMGPPLSLSAASRTKTNRAGGKDEEGRFHFCSMHGALGVHGLWNMKRLMTRHLMYILD